MCSSREGSPVVKLSYTSISTPDWPLEEMIAFADEAGYDAIELRCDYYEPHAHGVSLSGTGPSFVAVGPRERLEPIRDNWNQRTGTTWLTTTRNDAAQTI